MRRLMIRDVRRNLIFKWVPSVTKRVPGKLPCDPIHDKSDNIPYNLHVFFNVGTYPDQITNDH